MWPRNFRQFDRHSVHQIIFYHGFSPPVEQSLCLLNFWIGLAEVSCTQGGGARRQMQVSCSCSCSGRNSEQRVGTASERTTHHLQLHQLRHAVAPAHSEKRQHQNLASFTEFVSHLHEHSLSFEGTSWWLTVALTLTTGPSFACAVMVRLRRWRWPWQGVSI